MKASHLALLTLVLGLATGFAVGAVFGGPDTTSAAPRTIGLERDARVTPDTALSTEEVGIDRVGELPSMRDSSPSVARSSSAPGPGARSAARKAISLTRGSEPGQDSSAWTHKIQGAVVDADGDPMPGVQIVCLNRESSGWRGLMKGKASTELGRAWKGLPDVESELAKQAETLTDDRLHASTAISDATGGFTLADLREGAQTVQAYADGYEFAPQAVHTGRECTFVGERVVELELDIRLPDGAQPASAVIFPGTKNFGSELAWSPEEPRLRLKEAAFELVVRSGNVQRIDWRTQTSDYESEPRTMNVALEGAGPHVVELHANQILRVEVNDASELVPRLPVWVKVTSATDNPDGIDWTAESHTVLAEAPSGDFEVSGMPRGKYLLAAGRGDGNPPDVTQPITLVEGVTEARMGLNEAELGDFIVVHCTRADGSPVDQVEFDSTAVGARFAPPGRLKPLRRARGEYWVSRGLLFQGSTEETLLTASTPVDGASSATVQRDDTSVEIEFEPTCSLEVQVRGDLTAGYSVHAKRLGEDGEPGRSSYLVMATGSQRVKDDGHAVLNALQPGRYEVGLYQTGHDSQAGGYIGNSKQVAKETVEVKRVGQEVQLIVPESHTVMVRAEGLEAGKTLSLSPKNGSRYRDSVTAAIRQDSMARFDNVLAGDYVLRMEGGSDSTEITVPTGEVQFTTKVVFALKVRSVKEGGPAALAGFQKGDLITEISGKSVSGWEDLMTLMKSAGGNSIQVTILREQQSTGLSIGPVGEENGKAKSIGMQLTPESK